MRIELNQLYWDPMTRRAVIPLKKDRDSFDVRLSSGTTRYSTPEMSRCTKILEEPRTFASFLEEEALFIKTQLK